MILKPTVAGAERVMSTPACRPSRAYAEGVAGRAIISLYVEGCAGLGRSVQGWSLSKLEIAYRVVPICYWESSVELGSCGAGKTATGEK